MYLSLVNSCHYLGFNPYFALSALRRFSNGPPGPMAQAFTFRAFGAETRSFHTVSVFTSLYRVVVPTSFQVRKWIVSVR
jgi:hypothetical protein